MIYEIIFTKALAATLLIEVPIVYVFIIYIFKTLPDKKLKIIFVSILASTLTLPYVWFILPQFIHSSNYTYYAEFIVLIVEAIIYWVLLDLDILKSLIVSAVANTTSFLLGLWLNQIFFSLVL